MNLFASLVKGGGCNLLHSEGLKNSLDIESKLFLALFVFCSGAVPLYSSRSQNTKFISLSQSLPAYIKNLKKDFIIAIIYDIIYIGDLGEAVKK